MIDKETMHVTKLKSRGNVALPKSWLQALDLKDGEHVVLQKVDAGVLIRKVDWTALLHSPPGQAAQDD